MEWRRNAASRTARPIPTRNFPPGIDYSWSRSLVRTNDERRCPDCGAILQGLGPGDSLCSRCLALLAVHDPSEDVSPAPPSAAEPGARIGPYRLFERIGEGGMGVVYRAEQTEPVRRTVAIKLVRSGLDSKLVLARFEAERQALALMDHPGIARIHDAGTTATGQPYFVMEYVAGEPIHTYCDRRRLDTRARLRLFLDVCDAVQHAHQRGVIHRDLKPANILVAEVDGKAAVRVIDFGVAKAMGQKLTDRTLVTQFGTAVGTPAYMSP
jgi:serine/threonine protein kinase